MSLIGVIVAVFFVILANYIEGGQISGLMNLPAFLIVLGGTLGCVMVQFPFGTLKNTALHFKWLLRPPILNQYTAAEKILHLAEIARREGILVLEKELETIDDPFIMDPLSMVIDGIEKHTLEEILDTKITQEEIKITHIAKVYDAAGGYSPTMGIIGAVLGLIHAMGLLDKPDELGFGIAVAFVATIYGVAFANMIFLPIGSRYKLFAQELSQYRRMIADGICSIANGCSSLELKNRLASYSADRNNNKE